ncbi:MlaA family lipoprotein [Parasulfitobacter algicola]|uniref:VacJ family lipoprotein n=1 Tax=Parasulfitobacter algicola TaxID=2614809 RepID=A0ABX2IUA6_9RHOB|nr:VacJ family lipoprotein [Sulfitobacter algicola]NSX54427.1 VacJ family lipoprotein [Sulfitobacter algicola]
MQFIDFKAGRVFFAAILGLSVAGCSVPDQPTEIHDPYESTNRRVHDFNRNLDRTIVRPISEVYGEGVPGRAQQGISNFAANASLPSAFVNAILQGDIEGAGQNGFRFVVNTLIGFAGILDPATEMGIPEESADFGETLAVWGAAEGAYVELPVLGPSTQRDAAGRIVDIFTNPLSYALEAPVNALPPIAGAASRFGDRYRFSDTIDSVLYESADSYAQARLLYLQSRRFEVGQTNDDALIDPYEDPYDTVYDE